MSWARYVSTRPTRNDGDVWAVVLAGGEGGLRPLLRRALGRDRPPQYLPLLGSRTPLGETLDRVAVRVPTSRTVVVTVRSHVPHVAEQFTGVADPPYVLLQPRDRGTAAAVLHAARWIARRRRQAILAVLPSDQFVLGAATFMAHVLDVAHALASAPGRVALLGTEPTSPGSAHGWIERSAPLDPADDLLATVRALSPRAAEAGACGAGSGGWNTGVVVGSAAALIALGHRARPDLSALLDRAHAPGEPDAAALRAAYATMEAVSFEEMAAADPSCLAVSRLPRLTWCDLGRIDGLLAVLTRMQARPAWADAVDHSAVPA